MSFMSAEDFIDKNRKAIIKLQNQLLIKFADYVRGKNITFENQDRNIWVNCCICNDKPNNCLIINGEFTYVYLCEGCKNKFEKIIKSNTKNTT